MRSSEVRLRRMRAASRSAANAATPCEVRVAPAATRRGTRPLTRLRPVQTAANPRTEPEAARRLCQTPDGHRSCPPRRVRRTTGRRSVRRWFLDAQVEIPVRFGRLVLQNALHAPDNRRRNAWGSSKDISALHQHRLEPTVPSVAGLPLRRSQRAAGSGVASALSGSPRHLTLRSSRRSWMVPRIAGHGPRR
jgi:hypothetical protein